MNKYEEMQSIPGIVVLERHEDYKHIRDITYYDGPLISEFEDTLGNKIIYYWADMDNTANRWMVIHTTPEQIELLDQNKITARDFILQATSGKIFFEDFNNDADVICRAMCDIKDIPEDYLPNVGAYIYFDKDNK